MNIYGQAMSSEQILAWTQCRKRTQGDILSWEQAIWEEKDLIAKEEPLEAVCSPKSQIVIPPEVAQEEALTLCKALGGTMRGIEEKHEEGTPVLWEHIDSQCIEMRIYKYHGVLGQYWDPETRTVKHQEEYIGGSRGCCVVLSLESRDLNTNHLQPRACQSHHCTLCKTLPSPKQFYLRGSLTPDIDQLYVMDQSQGVSKFYFLGATKKKRNKD